MTVKQYYQVLEIPSTATADDIKNAYRRLALKWHPDQNPNNQDEATRKFNEISGAYEFLSDENRRMDYDNISRIRSIFASEDGSNYSSVLGLTYACSLARVNNFSPRPAEDVFREFFQNQDPVRPLFGYSAPSPTTFGGMGDGNRSAFNFGASPTRPTTPSPSFSFGQSSWSNSGTGSGNHQNSFSFSSPSATLAPPNTPTAAPVRPANIARSEQPMFSFDGSTSSVMRDGSQSAFRRNTSTAPTLVTSLTPPTPPITTTPTPPPRFGLAESNVRSTSGTFNGNRSPFSFAVVPADPTTRTLRTPNRSGFTFGNAITNNTSNSGLPTLGSTGRSTVWESTTSVTTRIENGTTTVTKTVVEDGVETITVHVNGELTQKTIRKV